MPKNNNGSAPDSVYPYVAKAGTCVASEAKQTVAFVDSYTYITPKSELALMQALTIGVRNWFIDAAGARPSISLNFGFWNGWMLGTAAIAPK